MAARFKVRTSFTVPATAGNYAPERITFGNVASATQAEDLGLLGVSAFIESNTATGAVLELWMAKIGGDGTDASYFNSGISIGSGLTTQALAGLPGVQFRAKSGGTAGSMVVNASAD